MSRNIHRINRPLQFLVAVSIAFMLIGICSGSIMAQATSTTTNTQMPFTASLTDCNSQPVVVSGTMHMVTHFTTDATGGIHFDVHSNWQDVSGTSGTITYRAVSNNEHSFNNSGAQTEFTVIDDVRLISQGPTDNLTMRATMHITVNANGEVTASFTRFEVVCSG